MQIPVYVINLKARRDRAEWISKRLGGLGIDFELVEATEAATLNEDFQVWLSTNADWPFRPGDLGCLRSHQAVWRLIRDGSADFGLVLEDDVHISDDLVQLVSDSTWIPADADLVKCETHLSFGTRIDRKSTSTIGSCRVHRLRGRHLGAAAYILSKPTAAAILEKSVNRSIDYFLFDELEGVLDDFTVYQVVPAPCIQGSISIEFGGWPENPLFESAIKATPATGRKSRKPRPSLTEPVRKSLYLSYKLGLPAWALQAEGNLRFAAFRAYWRLRGQTMGPVPFGGTGIAFGSRRKS